MLADFRALRADLDRVLGEVERLAPVVAAWNAGRQPPLEAPQGTAEPAEPPTLANGAAAPGAPKRRRGRPRESVRAAADKVLAALDAIGRNCHQCGSPLPDDAAGRRIYCTPSCRTLAYRARREAGQVAITVPSGLVAEPDPDLAPLPDNPERPFTTGAAPDAPERAVFLAPPRLSWEAS